jgi:uncharacterized protein (TIGR03437 family)
MILSQPAQAQYYCEVNCSASAPTTGTAGTAVTLSGSATPVYCDGSPSYQWDFGDNSTSTEQSTTHTYANPGTYNWSFKVTVDGVSCTRAGQITIQARTNTMASVSAASYAGSQLARSSIVAAFGTGLATTTEVASSVPLPTQLAGTTLKVKDSANMERDASLFLVAPSQINYLIPPETAVGTATVSVINGVNSVATGTIQIASVAPGLFSANASGQGVAAAVILRVKADGTQSYEPIAQYDTAQNRFVSVPIDFGPETDQLFLLLFGTGIQGRSTMSAVTVSVGGTNSQALYAGPQGGYVGLDQVNLSLPRSLIGRGEVDIVLTIDNQPANIVRFNAR